MRRPLLKLQLLASVVLLAGGAATEAAGEAAPGASVAEVVVTGRGDFRPGALKTDIVKTEVISAKAIERLDAQNLNQAIDKNPGIAVQTECSICNVRTINLNNLPGRFTTIEIDGVPIFSSLSGAYSLDSVNVRGVESIDVARGAGASLIAPQALSGVVNVRTKRPTARELEVTGEVGSQGSRIFGLYGATPLNDRWAGSVTFSYNHHDSVDNDGNGVSEYTG